MPACSHWAAVADIHATDGAAAAAINIDVGPDHGPAVNPETTDRYAIAAECSSLASVSHAVAAINNGAAPAPTYIRPELISGGKPAKSTVRESQPSRVFGRCDTLDKA
jgi:hypothetical protein